MGDLTVEWNLWLMNMTSFPRQAVCYAGAPSLVNAGGSVGATDLLSASQGEVIEVDMSCSREDLAAYVEDLIGARSDLLAEVGRAAALKARSWTETANAEQLVSLLQSQQGDNIEQLRPK